MSSILKDVVFNPQKFQQELQAFDQLLKSKADLSERDDIQPFFKSCEHLTAYLGTFAPNIAVATEICFEFEILGDYRADILLGSKKKKTFLGVEFEDGAQDSIFKKQNRNYPEWSARFEHGFSQIVDWFYVLENFKHVFLDKFGSDVNSFTGLLVMGRSLAEKEQKRLDWRADTVSIGKHKVSCMTYDGLHDYLKTKFDLYTHASRIETTTNAPGVPPLQGGP